MRQAAAALTGVSAFLIDLDGTVYQAGKVIDGAELVALARNRYFLSEGGLVIESLAELPRVL